MLDIRRGGDKCGWIQCAALRGCGRSGEKFVNQNSQSGFIKKILYNSYMKKLFIFIFVLFFITASVFANTADNNWRRLAVYDLQGNKLLSFPELSIEYYSSDFIVVRDKTNNYYITDKTGKRLNDRSYLVLGYPLITISDGNFIQLIKAKTVQDNDAEMVIYNKKGEVVFPQDKISNYEPLGFKYLKDGRIIGTKKSPSSLVIFEANKSPLLLDTPEKLVGWLKDSKIDKTDYSAKWTPQMSTEEKHLSIEYNILENWLKNPDNVYYPSDDNWIVFRTRDGAGIRDQNYPTRVLVKPSPEYQNIVLEGKHFAYYTLGMWGIKGLDGTVPGNGKFKNLPIFRGGYIFSEE